MRLCEEHRLGGIRDVHEGECVGCAVDVMRNVVDAAAALAAAPGRPMRTFCREYEVLMNAVDALRASRLEG